MDAIEQRPPALLITEMHVLERHIPANRPRFPRARRIAQVFLDVDH
jgi:hypothetical protein